MTKIIRMMIKTKDGRSVCVRPEDLETFAKFEKEKEEGRLLERTPEELEKMKEQVLIRSDRQMKSYAESQEERKRLLEQQGEEETYFYMEAASGRMVRVPASKLEAWTKAQDAIRAEEKKNL